MSYTRDQRSRVAETGGYLSHVGGLLPYPQGGALHRGGHGVRGLRRWQRSAGSPDPEAEPACEDGADRDLEPDGRGGRLLQAWLAIPEERGDWVVADVSDVSPTGRDFIYLYRPLPPNGPGEEFHGALQGSSGSPGSQS